MGVLRGLLALPIAGPINGGIWVARKIYETAEAELNDPAVLRKELVNLEQELLDGTISEADYDLAEADILLRIKAIQ
ncbi:gas vesicle protein GvpG [Cognatiyoonia sp. IB215446]|uniref:gas vesicle protein GvpG n=1 Tax=Cognatiyoonia sp. IB215446 TaxID=3097355 RepID=UPI002A1566CF|nr:gas vesicle protein GvpG [Cognatiyoonia sp. IB215446]MDX8348470.1 gas vesicle protein GvpG [Cognatiyoonia sp. IB215446]